MNNNEDRKSIVTYTGRYFNFNNITKDSVSIEDITYSLPKINRFLGHSFRPYSVGEHTIMCYLMAKQEGYSVREQLLTLMHDFTEAYVGDCPAPLKSLLPKFEEIEKEVELAIYEHFDIEPPTDEEYAKIKKIDLTMLAIEMKYLTLHNHEVMIGEDIYGKYLNDEEFKLDKNSRDSYDSVRFTLRYLFEKLLKEYNEEVV